MTELVTPQAKCDTSDRVTNSLLGYGVIAGPVYVMVSLAQAFTRDGFDLSRHQWSLLANGTGGWIQVTNFIATGLMLIAMAVGVRRAVGQGVGSRWAPRLIGVFGLSLITAAVFRADPALGFPSGTPEGPASVSASGLIHFAAAGIGFTCVAAACFVLARRYAAEGEKGWARFSRGTGVAFLAGFACAASGGGSAVANLLFTAVVLLVFTWTTAVSVDLSRSAGHAPVTGPADRPVRITKQRTRSNRQPQEERQCATSFCSRAPSSPKPHLCCMQAIMELGGEATQSGAMIDNAGLAPSAAGARVQLSSGHLSVMDGPFAEAKELISYAIYDVGSKEEAVEWTSRFMRLHQEHVPGWEGECDVVKIFGPEDFAPPA